MRTDTTQTVRLEDYVPYPFDIETVELTFSLEPENTKVEAILQIVRKAAGSDTPLVLDGEALDLLGIWLDGHKLTEGDYVLTDTNLTIKTVPDTFTLKTEVTFAPAKNTALSGLYMSGGRFCTQCEATGFRRITFWPDRPDVMSRFSVSINADKAAYPILLSNGTPQGDGDLDAGQTGRHFATWSDPHRKPSYLFALCAGAYDVYRDTFTTMSGRKVDLAIHVDTGEADKAAWAMDCLKRAMTWDEEVFGREYDLDVFNIVAVRDFNFGAMENKGLNIFNSAYVLADEKTATDADFEAIESIVAHEYFHNWTGNRITCRDWFQLCLKEGLTVFRDQEFSADMRSRPVQRIKDVIRLRARQFPEDAGPLAHPVRPESYGSIDNLYTATVYEKGAELIRMLKRLIGEDAFQEGMALYFDRHDGDAATIEDFYACFETASGKDLTHFRLWYAQPGTPHITVREAWNADTRTLTLDLMQGRTSPQDDPDPMLIPLAACLLNATGKRIEMNAAEDVLQDLVLATESKTVTIGPIPGKGRPYLSLLSGFSAPVILERGLSDADILALAQVEQDPFNRWDLLQGLLKQNLLARAYDNSGSDASLVDALAKASLAVFDSDPAYAALVLRLPDVGELFLQRTPANPVALAAARKSLKSELADFMADHICNYLGVPAPAPFQPNAEQAGTRALRGTLMDLAARSAKTDHLLPALFADAHCMTEQQAALSALISAPGGATEALSAFYHQWRTNPLVIDKWFAAQARSSDPETVTELASHADFDLGNPNRVRALAGNFAMNNLAAFHHPSGSGHAFLADIVRKVDPRNPALAARLLTAFEQWRSLEPLAYKSAEMTLISLQKEDLSQNAGDIVSRALG